MSVSCSIPASRRLGVPRIQWTVVLASFEGDEGVLFIGKAQEKARVFRTEKRRHADDGSPCPCSAHRNDERHTYDFEIGRALRNLPARRKIGFTANRRLLCVESLTTPGIIQSTMAKGRPAHCR